MDLPIILPELESVEFNLSVLIELFRFIVYTWNNSSITLFGWLLTPFSDLISETFSDIPLLSNVVDLITPLYDQIYGPDFSMLALLSGSFIMFFIVMSFISVILYWVLEFIPG